MQRPATIPGTTLRSVFLGSAGLALALVPVGAAAAAGGKDPGRSAALSYLEKLEGKSKDYVAPSQLGIGELRRRRRDRRHLAVGTLDAQRVGAGRQILKSIDSLFRCAGRRHGLPMSVSESYPCLARFAFEHEQANALRTLFTQGMLEHGFLAGPAFYPTLAHTEDIVEQYAGAVDAVFAELAQALNDGAVADRLVGPPAHEGFQRLI